LLFILLKHIYARTRQKTNKSAKPENCCAVIDNELYSWHKAALVGAAMMTMMVHSNDH
jgi:hypothetical protein